MVSHKLSTKAGLQIQIQTTWLQTTLFRVKLSVGNSVNPSKQSSRQENLLELALLGDGNVNPGLINPWLINRACNRGCPLLVGIQTTFGGNTPPIMGRVY